MLQWDDGPEPPRRRDEVLSWGLIVLMAVLFVVALIGSFDDYANGWPQWKVHSVTAEGR